MKSHLFQFIEGQAHFSISWQDKMSDSMNQYRMLFVHNSTLLPPSMHPKTYGMWKGLYANDKLPTKSHPELEDNFDYYANYISKTLVYMTIHARHISKFPIDKNSLSRKHSPPEMTCGAARLRFSANSALLV